jgi:hypothetical protein
MFSVFAPLESLTQTLRCMSRVRYHPRYVIVFHGRSCVLPKSFPRSLHKRFAAPIFACRSLLTLPGRSDGSFYGNWMIGSRAKKCLLSMRVFYFRSRACDLLPVWWDDSSELCLGFGWGHVREVLPTGRERFGAIADECLL